jgi:hypothetical protein
MWKAISMVCLLVIAITTLQGAVTYASIAYAPSPEQMFANSDLVVTGTVLDINARWGEGNESIINTRWGQGNESIIVTVVKLGVEDVAKGEPHEKIIEVNYPGGEMGELWLWVEDQPTFTVGEHVLLYLKSRSTPLDGTPRYTLTSDTFFGKSDAAGNTTIGADGEQVPIVIVATAPWDVTETGSEKPDHNDVPYETDVFPAAGILITELSVPVEAYPLDETVYVNISVIASRMPGELSPVAWAKSYPITVNGNVTGVTIPVSLMAGESRTFNATLVIPSPREMRLNPLATPSTYVDYTVIVGGLERDVRLYAWPDYTYLIVGLGIIVIIASAILIMKVRRV